MSLVPITVHRWRVKLWLAAVAVAERRLRTAYNQLVATGQQDQADS